MRARRGFTLVELMVALLVGAIGVAVAFKVAQTVIRQSAKGRQVTDLSSRSRLLGRQLRNDLRTAGFGSTGAVAVDGGRIPWNTMGQATAAGFFAIPAVAGANNLGAVPVGGVTVRDGSDALQLVVPNGASLRRAQGVSPRGTNVVLVENSVTFQCPTGLIYVSDHTAPTGAGRAQLLFMVGAPNAVGIPTVDTLQFSVADGSDVMCARVSTYWVDAAGWLHRTDLTRTPPVRLSPAFDVYVDPSRVGPDRAAPGVLDMQVAFRVSAEVYELAGAPIPVVEAGQWAFEGRAGNADVLMNAMNRWFEVRAVRVNMLARTMRKIEDVGATERTIPRLEDGGADLTLPRRLGAEWITFSDAVTNLRFFDFSAPSGIAAEPY